MAKYRVKYVVDAYRGPWLVQRREWYSIFWRPLSSWGTQERAIEQAKVHRDNYITPVK